MAIKAYMLIRDGKPLRYLDGKLVVCRHRGRRSKACGAMVARRLSHTGAQAHYRKMTEDCQFVMITGIYILTQRSWRLFSRPAL